MRTDDTLVPIVGLDPLEHTCRAGAAFLLLRAVVIAVADSR